MSDSTSSTASSSPWAAAWRWVRDYWHWPVLVGVGVYLYLQLFPPVDLSEPARPAPAFAAQTLEGDPFRMEAQRGKIVVVNVWATWCPPCRVEMPGFVDLAEDLPADEVQFVGISVDQTGPGPVRDFVQEYAVSFPTIHSPQVAARYFPGNTVPRTYLIDRDGNIRYTHTGLWMAASLRDAIEELGAERGE